MLNQKLQQKLLQKLSPQQIQMIKLLEIPTMQLEQRIKKELEENPLLEEGREEAEADVQNDEEDRTEEKDTDNDEFSLEDYIDDEEIPSYRLSSGNVSKDEKREEIPFSVGSTFHEFLEAQLGLRKLNERQHALAEYLIGNIDEDGYLRRDLG
jgi:RNA polymerase sigma-54 factor